MPIDLNIDDWTLEHDRAVRVLIGNTAINHRIAYGENFPEDVMVIGGNWFYIGEAKPLQGVPDVTGDTGLTLEFSQAITINARQTMGMPKEYVPLPEILDYFKEDLPNEEMALFPLSEQRNEEARALGPTYQDHDDWYVVQRDNKRIKVFPLMPDTETIYFDTPERKGIGYTPIKKPPINLE